MCFLLPWLHMQLNLPIFLFEYQTNNMFSNYLGTCAMCVCLKEQWVFSCADVSPCTVICVLIYGQQARKQMCVFLKLKYKFSICDFPLPPCPGVEPSLPVNLLL